MKTTDCFMIILLLATAIATASSRTVTDYPVQSKLHGQELQLLINGRNNVKPMSLVGNKQQVVGAAQPGTVVASTDFGEVIGEVSRGQPEKTSTTSETLCMSKELSIRKKVICVKKCRSGDGVDVEVGLNHFPRCQVICRKCVPNC